MGLDITHYKATLEPCEPHTLFFIGGQIYSETGAEIREKFDGFNVDFDHFQKYIQKIEVPTEVDSVIIIKGAEHLAEVKEGFASRETTFIVKENEEQLQNELRNFEKRKGYQHLKKDYHDLSYANWIVLTYYTSEKKDGFYFKTVGEQRKGMNRKFWKKFCKEETSHFALKENFDEAYSYVDKYWDSDTKEIVIQRKAKFKKEFIDNFELGASFMFVSY